MCVHICVSFLIYEYPKAVLKLVNKEKAHGKQEIMSRVSIAVDIASLLYIYLPYSSRNTLVCLIMMKANL